MNDQTNTAVIQTIYTAFNHGDVQTILSRLTDDAQWVNYGTGAVAYFGDFSGRVLDFFKAIGESTMEGSVAIDRYHASGDVVVTEGRYIATARNTGTAINAPIAHIFTLRNGKVTSWRGYSDTAAVVAGHTGKSASA